MAKTTISSKFQIVIPRQVREEMGLETGQVLQVVGHGGVITLVPERPLKELRGYLKGMKTAHLREKRDRF